MDFYAEISQRFYTIECWVKDLIDKTKNVLALPPGGEEGEALIKSGDGLAWGEATGGGNVAISSLQHVVETDGQTSFPDLLPAGKTIISVSVEGYPQINDADVAPGDPADYHVQQNGIQWISEDLDLLSGFVIEILFY